MNKTRHLSINIQGLLKEYEGRDMGFVFEDNHGEATSDEDARIFLKECLDKGWKVLPMNDECDGFDHFGNGCPGHIQKEEDGQ